MKVFNLSVTISEDVSHDQVVAAFELGLAIIQDMNPVNELAIDTPHEQEIVFIDNKTADIHFQRSE